MHERVEPIPWKDGSTVATVGAPSMAANCKSPERSVPSKSWRAAECATPLITGIGFAVRYFRVQSKPRATGRREPDGCRKGATELCDRRGGRRRCFARPRRAPLYSQSNLWRQKDFKARSPRLSAPLSCQCAVRDCFLRVKFTPILATQRGQRISTSRTSRTAFPACGMLLLVPVSNLCR